MSMIELRIALPRKFWRTITSAHAIPNTVLIGIETATMIKVR